MTGYLVRRVLQSVVVMLIVSVIVFILLHALPGGLVRAQLGPKAATFQVHQLEVTEGLLKPLPVQYLIWLVNLLKGNLGFSYHYNQTVASLLARYVPRTLLLAGVATVLAIGIAIPMGIWQGFRRNRVDDHVLSASMLILYAMPAYLLGIIGVIVLSLDFPLFPSTATNYGAGFGTDVAVLILPIGTLMLGNITYYSRYMRSSVIDNLLEDYVRTARAVGNAPRRVLLNHVLRNSMSSTMTMIGLTLPYVLSGALIIEELFNFPGVGLLFWNATQTRDYPVLLGVVLVVTLAVVVGSLIADLGYAMLDPRVRYVRS
ncbi:MAG: ABC transporter permease [Streptosporangiaceae bacterium]